MKLITSLDDIPELRKDNVHIGNCDKLKEKINKIIKDGHKNLQIVTDFDHTLTRHTLENGNSVLTSFGMFRECPSIPQYYKDEDIRLAAIYKPIEANPTLSIAEKSKHMVHWYMAAHKMLKGVLFPNTELIDVGKNMIDSFRIGVKELINWCDAKKVPILVFSAGLGESVVSALKAANFLLPHVKVVSNFLDLDEKGTIVGIKGEVIHTYNKNESAIKNTEYYEMVRSRGNVILMGDNIGDAGMAEGMEHCDVVIKIGFLGYDKDGNLSNYLKNFDIVLVKEPTMDLTNAILNML